MFRYRMYEPHDIPMESIRRYMTREEAEQAAESIIERSVDGLWITYEIFEEKQ